MCSVVSGFSRVPVRGTLDQSVQLDQSVLLDQSVPPDQSVLP
jgi:hypothetical protein